MSGIHIRSLVRRKIKRASRREGMPRTESQPRKTDSQPEEPDPPLRSRPHDMALRRAWMSGLPLGLVPDLIEDKDPEEGEADRT